MCHVRVIITSHTNSVNGFEERAGTLWAELDGGFLTKIFVGFSVKQLQLHPVRTGLYSL